MTLTSSLKLGGKDVSKTLEEWTFDRALNILKISSDQERLESLDNFLSKNLEVLTNPLFLKASASETLPSSSEFAIRGVTYKINDAIKKQAEAISQITSVKKVEVARIIAELSRRIPEEQSKDEKVSDSKLLYISSVLKERRKVLELTRQLLSHGSIKDLGDKYARQFLENSNFIEKLIELLSDLSESLISTESYSQLIIKEATLSIIETIKLILALSIKVSTIPSNVSEWFKLWESNSFFEKYESSIDKSSFTEIKSLIGLTSLLLLGLNTNEDIFDPSTPYLSDPTSIRAINDSLINSPNNPLVLYAWSIVIYSIPPEVFEEAFAEDQDELSRAFAIKAASLKVFREINLINKVLIYDNFHTALLSSFLISAVPFIQLTDDVSKTYLEVFKSAPNSFVEKFFIDPNTQRLLDLTKAKFPEVITPYLRILSINGALAHNELSSLSTYMNIVSSSNLDYDIDSDSDTIVLKNGLHINPPYEQSKDVLLYLPPSTKGRLIPTSDPNSEAAIFQYNYNGWSLLGRIVQNVALYSDDHEILLVILGLITEAVYVADVDTISDIFEKLSSFTDDNDILDVILKLFEQSLHQRNVPILIQIIKFFIALTNTYPQIVWSHIVRSDLLEHAGRGGLISNILGAVETANGNYDFTIVSLKLFNELVINSLVGDEEVITHQSEVIPKLTNYAIQVFESFSYWNYVDLHQKYEIGTLVLDSFSKILYAVYGVDSDSDPSEKVTKVLAKAAKKIISAFTVTFPDVRIIKPGLAAIDELTALPSKYEESGRLGFWFIQWARESLGFFKLVISIRSVLDKDPSTLERLLFSKISTLVQIYTQQISLRSLVLQLLTQLVRGSWKSEPLSLLSHLGDHHSTILVASLSNDLRSNYDDFIVKKFIYAFFSAIVQGNQKGLAMIFVNGQEVNKVNQESLFSILKRDIQNIDYYPESLSIHLVDAIAYALNSWTSKRGEEDSVFVATLLKKLAVVDTVVENATNQEIIHTCYKYKLNSRIAEICALIIFTSDAASITKPITSALEGDNILNLISPLRKPFGYRASLHSNLTKNFEEKWPGLKLRQFIRSPLAVTTTFGEGAVYDLRLLDEILGSNPFWNGDGLTEGYRGEVIDASINLQYVSAQIGAAKSWGALLTAYVKKFSIPNSFWEVIKKLLEANIEEGTSIELFHEVHRVRSELAFFFLYTITKQGPLRDSQLKEILELALRLITSPDIDYLSSLSSNNSDFYRPLLRIIISLLTSAKGNTKLVELLSGQLLEFFEIVVAKGTTVLFDAIQTDINTPSINSRIEDLLLIISLFKAFNKTEFPASVTSKLPTILLDFNTLRSLLNIYSSSHSLLVNGEPIFAELALSYMIELVSYDGIAEQLIASGLFSILIESPISMTIQEGHVFAHTSPRLHNIWSNGLLAIILILLSKFGNRLLPEIGAFVGYFSKQISSTIRSWSQDNVAITIPAIHETEQIIILQKALKSLYYETGNSSFKRSQDSIEIIPGLDNSQGKKSLANALTHFLVHPKYLTSRVVPTTLEEQRLFEGDDKIRTPLVEQLVVQIQDLRESVTE